MLPTEIAAAPAIGRAKRGLILFCAEQGFAGPFSERVFEAAGGDLAEATTIVVGTRGVAVASERGIKPDWSAAMTTRVEGIPGFANRLAEVLYGYLARGAVATADILFARSAAGAIHIDRHSLLPIDFARFARPIQKQAPLIALAPELLLERLTAEYVYVQLCEAAMHAFVAENEARMIAMVAAKNNTETKLAALLQRERQLRQEEITTEIMELAAGAEASRTRESSAGIRLLKLGRRTSLRLFLWISRRKCSRCPHNIVRGLQISFLISVESVANRPLGMKGHPMSAALDNRPETNRLHIGQGVTVRGVVLVPDTVVVDGVLEGDISVGNLLVSEKGTVNGRISVTQNAEIAGQVFDRLDVKGLLILRSSCRVDGNLSCGILTIERGASITGGIASADYRMGQQSAKSNRKLETRSSNVVPTSKPFDPPTSELLPVPIAVTV